MSTVCHVETYREDGSRKWGWQCFTCRQEFGGFLTMAAAEEAGDGHRVRVLQQDPPAHEKCRDLLRDMSVETGTEITVSLVPPIVAGPYSNESFTCPHGTTFYIEPTGEQIAQWAKDGVR